MTDDTSSEIGTQGPDVDDCVRDAISGLHLGSDPSMNAGRTLARSERFWRAVEPARRELLEQVRQDMGGTEDAPQTLLAIQEAFVEASLFRRSLFLRLVDEGGPVTNKGRTRALYTAYVAALDRELKHAQVLGLQKRAKKVQSVAEVLA